MFRPIRTNPLGSWLPPLGRALTAVAVVAMAMGAARAELAWHADLDAARAASRESGKPVLAVFEASWDAAAADPQTDVLASPEVEAVVGACFEPVRLDVDQHGDLARDLAVEHVPAARVLDRDAKLLASFDCPATPSEFVAAAARAAQVAAGSAPHAAVDVATNAFGPGGRAEHETASAVSAKVRQLSSFADGEASTPSPAPATVAAAAAPPVAVGSRYSEPPAAPALSTAPPPWRNAAPAPAESAATPVQPAAPPAPAVQPSLDPKPAAPTSWLAGTQPTPAPGSAPVAGSASAPVAAPPDAAAAAAPGTTAATPAAPEAEKPESSFWATLQKPWSIFSKSSTKPTTEPPAPPPTMPAARPQWPALARPEQPVDQYGPMPLGLEGYCPVTVVERGSWVEGRPQWGVRHRGRTYLFAGPEQQQAFMADPDRYAPALSGDDPVLAFERGRSEPGRRAYGVSYQSRMYLFSSPETRASFTADPDRYTARVMIAEGTAPADGIRRF